MWLTTLRIEAYLVVQKLYLSNIKTNLKDDLIHRLEEMIETEYKFYNEFIGQINFQANNNIESSPFLISKINYFESPKKNLDKVNNLLSIFEQALKQLDR